MEVGSLGQGGQVSLNVNKNVDNTATTNNSQGIDNIKIPTNTKSDNNTSKNNTNEKDVNKAIDKLNVFLSDNKTHAEYEIHDKFKDIMIKIVDDKTGQVIQELPPKKILDLVAKMVEMAGILFDKKA